MVMTRAMKKKALQAASKKVTAAKQAVKKAESKKKSLAKQVRTASKRVTAAKSRVSKAQSKVKAVKKKRVFKPSYGPYTPKSPNSTYGRVAAATNAASKIYFSGCTGKQRAKGATMCVVNPRKPKRGTASQAVVRPSTKRLGNIVLRTAMYSKKRRNPFGFATLHADHDDAAIRRSKAVLKPTGKFFPSTLLNDSIGKAPTPKRLNDMLRHMKKNVYKQRK